MMSKPVPSRPDRVVAGRSLATAALLALALATGPAAASPFVPEHDDVVVETLPPADPFLDDALRALRAKLAEDPTNLSSAVRLAAGYTELGRARADPRYDGYAEAALAPWWQLEAPPVPVLLLRATLAQRKHAFAAALADLDRALARQPDHLQAWLSKATILALRGEPDQALAACRHLRGRLDPLIEAGCIASVARNTRDAAAAYRMLITEVGRSDATDLRILVWTCTLLGELAAQLGDPAAAEQHFLSALAAGSDDPYLLGAYADLLLDQGRADAVRDLLEGWQAVDPLLLRLAIAEDRLGHPARDRHVDMLASRFETARRRGDVVHRREEARFALALLHEPERALELALANVAVQREPADLRLVLEAALAAGAADAAEPTLQWLRQTGLVDPQIRTLLRAHRGGKLMRTLLLAAGLILLGGSAAAHQPSNAYLTLEVQQTGIDGRWDIALRDLEQAIGLDRDRDGRITWGEVRQREPEIAAYALARLELGAGDVPCRTAPGTLALDRHGQNTYAVLGFTATCTAPLDRLDVGYSLLFDLDRSHRGLLKVGWAETTSTAVLGPETGTLRFERGAAGSWPVLASYVPEGFRHILTGYDHILFLLALLLSVMLRLARGGEDLRRALAELAAVVSAFTIGHSITLALAALGVVDPPSRLIESLIALSVVLAALNNVVPVVERRVWLIALGFGLIHGFGFAGVLRELGLPDHGLIVALFGFNLGVELGQLAIVALFVPLVLLIERLDLYPRALMRLGSSAIVAVALLWLIERAFDLPLISALPSLARAL